MVERQTTAGQDASNSAPHVPVMLCEVLEALDPKPGKVIIDGTFGAGGYSKAILGGGGRVVAIDRDPDAIVAGKALVDEYSGALTLNSGGFSQMEAVAEENGFSQLDGVVLDIGVSSMQVDQAARGFSFAKDGALDMRMEKTGVSAADVVNQARRQDLTRILGTLGEEKKASQISAAIEKARFMAPITGTLQLAKIVENAIGRDPKSKIHPATRTFQALRIFINHELEELVKALFAAERLLRAGGRLVVVSFHSLEDRIVKRFFANRCQDTNSSRHLPALETSKPTFVQTSKRAQSAGEDEISENPRARSAKLRWAMRTEYSALGEDWSLFKLPNLVSLKSFENSTTGAG